MSGIFLGGDAIKAIKVGDQDAKAVYVGSEQVWPTTGPLPSFTDDFHRPNELLGASPYWTQIAGQHSIVSNVLRQTGTNNAENLARCDFDVGSSDMAVEIQQVSPGASNGGGFTAAVVRYVDANNFYMARESQANMEIWRRVSGTFTRIGVTAGAAPSHPFTIRLEVEGSSLRLYLNDVLTLSASDSSITNSHLGGIRSTRNGMELGYFTISAI